MMALLKPWLVLTYPRVTYLTAIPSPCLNLMQVDSISGQWKGDNEKLCAMYPYLWLKRFPSTARIKPRPGLTGLTH